MERGKKRGFFLGTERGFIYYKIDMVNVCYDSLVYMKVKR